MNLNRNSFPFKDYAKAKKLFWDPADLDYTQDKADWAGLNTREQAIVRQVLGLFLAGEAYVTHDLAPLLVALRHSGAHLEEEMFLTSQLFEESKHVEFFADVLDMVLQETPDYSAIMTDNYKTLFEQELGSALNRLLTDHSPHAQVEAVVTYHMTIEGMLAETAYYGLFKALRDQDLMPAFSRGLELVQRDEARHVAFGLYLLQRLVTENPELWPVMEARIHMLLGVVQGIIVDIFNPFLPDVPLGLDMNDILTYAAGQFQARMGVLERVKSKAV